MNESGDIVTDLAVVVDLFNAYAILLLVAGVVYGRSWVDKIVIYGWDNDNVRIWITRRRSGVRFVRYMIRLL